jgi:nucleotide-binding universal stress UspA family protein
MMEAPPRPPRTTVAHTTDLSGQDGLAFLHACALAAAGGAPLVSLHGNAPPEVAERLPDGAEVLARWNRARRETLGSRTPLPPIELMHERRCHQCCDDVTDTLLDALTRMAPALVVTGTHARHGLSALLHDSVSEALARNLDAPVLVVPNHGRGFVDQRFGTIDLRRILIPAADATTAAAGLSAARTLCALAGATSPELLLFHVGPGAAPLVQNAEPGVRVVRGSGELDRAIVEAARAESACAIVMPTHGHDSLHDALLGSHTDHVIREAGCPVLAVPLRAHGEG